MESLKIRDKKTTAVEEENEIEVETKVEQKEQQTVTNNETQTVVAHQSVQETEIAPESETNKRVRLTFGQSLMEKVKKFFEEVE